MFSTTACHLYMSPNKVDDGGPSPANNIFSNNSENGNGSMSSNSSRTIGRLTHVSAESGEAHMVSIADKAPSRRVARARCRVRFSNRGVLDLIREDQMKKGDVLGVARVAGIMAAKRTPDLIPLCHPIAITHVGVNLDLVDGGDGGSGSPSIDISATVSCDGKTGVEMEALTAASTAALTVYDMCKAVDKGMVVEDLTVVFKEK
jgi:cyclic pyranopterin phosphate synthase